MPYRRKDTYYRRARAAGYRARSAYKLAELDRRYGLLRRGDFVVDLGAWPGAWLQVTLERIGPEGRVVGVDLVPVEPLPAPNVALVKGDVAAPETSETVRGLLGRAADVVLSDLAPKLTGIRATDEARLAALAEAMIGALPRLLRPGGRLLTKLFMTPDYETLLGELRTRFARVTTTRPEASRRGSAELYVIGFDHRAEQHAG
jgi:23S rRNA (uridine2552-2'-O)-methyltransferase